MGVRRITGLNLKKVSDIPIDKLRGRDGLNGRDGKDGINGRDGVNGKDGEDGKDGTTTVIHQEVILDITELRESIDELSDRVDKIDRRRGEVVSQAHAFSGGVGSDDLIYATGDTGIGINNTIVVFSGGGTAKLPPKPKEDQRVTIKQGSNSVAITIDGNGKYIDGASTYVISATTGQTVFTGIDLIYMRTQWYII